MMLSSLQNPSHIQVEICCMQFSPLSREEERENSFYHSRLFLLYFLPWASSSLLPLISLRLEDIHSFFLDATSALLYQETSAVSLLLFTWRANSLSVHSTRRHTKTSSLVFFPLLSSRSLFRFPSIYRLFWILRHSVPSLFFLISSPSLLSRRRGESFSSPPASFSLGCASCLFFLSVSFVCRAGHFSFVTKKR